MARKFIDGWESGDQTLWTYTTGSVATAAGEIDKSGTYYLKLSGVAACYKNLPANEDELYFSMRWWNYAANGYPSFYCADSAFTTIFTLIRNTTTGYLEARLGGVAGTLLATGTTVITQGVTYLIEVRYKPLNTGGIIQVKIDGSPTLDIDYSGDTTAGNEEIRRFGMVGPTSNWLDVDDFRVDDAAWIGNSRIQGIWPTGVGATTAWDPSTGANWECVNEKPYSDADYVSTNVSDEVDTYGASDLSGAISTIQCVQIHARAAKEGSPTPTQLQLVVRPASTDRVSDSKALPTTFGEAIYNIWELNPEDSAAWETADVNGMEIGVKAVA